jgi:hypothetical protein
MISHWDAIQAGRTVSDPLLLNADRCFLDALLLNPNDYNALNGLGSVLILEQDVDTAEFFIRRAIAVASQSGLDYSTASISAAPIIHAGIWYLAVARIAASVKRWPG